MFRVEDRESIVSFNEIVVGTKVASLARLWQQVRINTEDNSELVVSDNVEILWGKTKESLISEADAKIISYQAEVIKEQEKKDDLGALAVEVKP